MPSARTVAVVLLVALALVGATTGVAAADQVGTNKCVDTSIESATATAAGSADGGGGGGVGTNCGGGCVIQCDFPV